MTELEKLQEEIKDLKLRVLELETDNRKSFRKLSSFKEDGKELYIVIAEYSDYTLIYRGTQFDPWVVAYGYRPKQKCWDQGHYFDVFADALLYLIKHEPILFYMAEELRKENKDETEE